MPDAPKVDELYDAIAPVIANDPATGHSGLVVDCPQHALPFGVIFEEYAARRRDDLKQHAAAILSVEPEKVLPELQRLLTERDGKYHELEAVKANPKSSPSAVDQLERECFQRDLPFKRLLHKMNGTALCLSGGGIRSASFGMGVLEGLARFSLGLLSPTQKLNCAEKPGVATGLLHELDYLSTVSGGGYIGSWLAAWIYRRRTAETTEAASWGSSYRQVVKALAGESNLTSGDPAPQPVRHLREYTAYLAPAMGLSLDSWDLAAIVFRNLMINWVMLLPLLLAAMAIPQVSYYVSRDLPLYLHGSIAWGALLLVLALFLLAAFFSGLTLPSHRKEGDPGPTLLSVFLGFAGPVLLANWLVIELWRSHYGTPITPAEWSEARLVVFGISGLGFLAMAISLFISNRKRVLKTSQAERVQGLQGFLRFLGMLAAAVTGALATTALLAVLARWFPHLIRVHPWKYRIVADDRLFAILALPLFTLVPLMAVSLFVGLMGVFEEEEDREWLSRAGAIQLAIIIFWIGIHAISLYAGDTLAAIMKLAVSGAALGGLGSALGWSGTTSAGPRPVKAAQLGKVGAFLKDHDMLLPGLCTIALLFITLGVAGIEHTIARKLNIALDAQLVPVFCAASSCGAAELGRLWSNCYLLSHAIVLGGFLGIALLINRAININLFSLHGMYRMRLMRAFLGASNTQRSPDSFTQFDAKDTPKVVDLARTAGAPLHVVNTTLNLVGTKNLAWRQRKAESFTFTSLHSGCWRLAYVPTRVYAGADGVSLATAMAISGAAFNPNMGYHSSPLVTLLMTFFNVRLGWWLPNPAREEGARHLPFSAKGSGFLHKTGPTMALEPLILEAFGLTDDTYRWIELTDGGHFENLGLYEMVLRRCHNIIVVDAGADPDCQFEDLGNALRKIQIDLGIPIRFDDGIKMKAGAKPDNRYCAVATIDYGCVDDYAGLPEDERAKLAGRLIYIKAGLTGQEPPDIKQYALTHATFPHEATANQFFNEAQFESYRHLGSNEVEQIARRGSQTAPPYPDAPDLDRMVGKSGVPLGRDFDSFAKAATNYAINKP